MTEINERLKAIESRPVKEDPRITSIQEMLGEQAEQLGHLAADVHRLHGLVVELLPIDRRPTVRMPAVTLTALKNGNGTGS